ncbi:MAG: hypothetical protein ACREQD_10765 [Candidatus Binataceae bacterium]
MRRRTASTLCLAAWAAIAGGVAAPGADRAFAQASVPAKPAPGIPAALPPDVAFGRFIALIRGHLLAGDDLVKARDWTDALPDFRYPLEEIYGVIRDDLRSYKTPQFDGALKALARTVAKRNVRQYQKARQRVDDALAAADANLKARQFDWPRFELEIALAVLKTAPDEYEVAVAKGRMIHPGGYQTARGFILQSDRMIESVAPELAAKNADAMRDIRDGFVQLRRAFATVTAPKRPAIDDAVLLETIARIEMAARKLM